MEVYLRPAHAIVLVASIVMVVVGTMWVQDGVRVASAMPTLCNYQTPRCTLAEITDAQHARMGAAAGGFLRATGTVLLVALAVVGVAAARTAIRERRGPPGYAPPGKGARLLQIVQRVGTPASAILIVQGLLAGFVAVLWAAAGSECGGGGPLPHGAQTAIIYYNGIAICSGTLSVFPSASVDLAALGGASFGVGLFILAVALS